MTRKWLGPVVIAAMVVFTVVVWSALPERIPSHWSIRGEVDGWSGRTRGALLAPAMAVVVWLLLPLLRRVDPRRRNYDRFEPTFWLVVNVIVLFLAVVHVLTLGAALGWGLDMTRALLALVGLMFAGLGNYLPRLRSNWWMGIRTPWTLESDAVWRATHRLAGHTFVIAGLGAMGAALWPGSLAFVVALGAMMLGAFIPAIYSYFAWRREGRPADGAGPRVS
jgi:uncharacterized membrane protein